MEFIESERGNQKLNIKPKKNCGGQLSKGGYCPRGQLSGGLLSCSHIKHAKHNKSFYKRLFVLFFSLS